MAITTMYAGIEYRSRLEARWAAFFTRLGWHYTYEPFDGDGYIPDFLIHGERPMLVEIKPAVTFRQYAAPTAKAENGLREWDSDILILGADPLPQLDVSFNHMRAAGLLGEIVGEGEWQWATAVWMTCGNCNANSVFHDELTYAARPCGCYDGDRYIHHMNWAALQSVWASACNEVKWRGKAA